MICAQEIGGEDQSMRFRLIYSGELKADGNATHKHEIRKALHPQLRRLWDVSPNLKDQEHTIREGQNVRTYALWEWLGLQNERHGYKFVPLVLEEHELLVSLHVLYLRPGAPGRAVLRGDIDNRIKTLFDALRMPGPLAELGKYVVPDEGELPFFVLLSDDKLITELSVETDTLLRANAWAQGRFLSGDSHLVITADIRPAHSTPRNRYFA